MINKLKIAVWILLLASSLFVAGCAASTKTESPADFYKEKTLTMAVSSEPGNFIDLRSRIFAKYLADECKATVLVENRREAGGLEGTNYLFKANPDGLTLGSVSSVKFISNKVLNDPAAVYEIDKFSYIMKIDSEQTYFFVSSTGPYQTINELKSAKNLKIAAGTASGYITLAGLTIVDILGLDAKVITGFQDNTARSLATQRGEVAGFAISLGAVKTELEAGTLIPMFVLSTTRDPVRPDIPAITELINLNDDDIALVKLWENNLSGATLIAAPPNLPEEKLSFLCNLSEGFAKNETFRQEINSVSGYEVLDYLSGKPLNQSLYDMAANLNDFQSRFVELISKYRS